MFIRLFLLLLAISSLSAGRVPQLEERIIGGSDIEIEQAPWQVSLQVEGRHVCGGSIYSKDIIITAAHCLFDDDVRQQLDAKNFRISVGSSLKNSNESLVKVAAIKSHERFHDPPYKNDIAVMRLSEPLEFSNKVQPIPLADNNPRYGTPAFASGWGATSFELVFVNGSLKWSPTYPTHLQGVSLRIRSFFFMPQDIIYAGVFGQSGCRGDSGGPLVVDKQLVGVVSSGPKLCDGKGKFTSVPAFRNWILDAIKSF
ncbi:trypsin alpha-like [Drosophila takahashii]|uniref:trypsin alpha-like n=1 Tax=Drosophila takahashii TaxID=29030 RepID=UPI001CF8AFFE|nr:trypsin alpha-like [Drosophila takahashii]